MGFVRLFVLFGLFLAVLSDERTKIYNNEFAVHIPDGIEAADEIAGRHNFINRGQIGSLHGFYLFEHNRINKRSTSMSDAHHQLLQKEEKVIWFEQQTELIRKKRDIFQGMFRGFREFGMQPQPAHLFNSPSSMPLGQPAPQGFFSRIVGQFPDPMWGEQWYMHGGAADGFDMNVVEAWRKGYTGKGVVVSILDDGIQTNHPDLVFNYDPLASTDINGNDDDPMPQDNGDNKHGTRCAGEVAATAFNNVCGVGVAYNSSIGGVRMLDGTVNDAVEARALSLNPGHIHIYSASWGPEDDGKTVDGPGPLAKRAFIEGVQRGRNGLGSIFVWASGNGGRHLDNCNCDGYTNSIFTLSISSATQRGLKPWYLEECSSTLATTYSSGTPGHDKSVVTVDMDMTFHPDSMCTREHTGTSASAPIAGAIVALALEANPHLTWRDLQHLVVMTSRPDPLEKEDGWVVNGVRRKVSHKFGYGLMDAAAMVTLAERWLAVPPQHICHTPEDQVERVIPDDFGGRLEVYLDTDACWGSPSAVNYLEHVQARITLRFNPRGNLRIILESPLGTRSSLLLPRPRDIFQGNFDDWPFLSVHFWGEKGAGRWKLSIINSGTRRALQPGVLKRWSLVFYGTDVNPVNLRHPLPSLLPMAFSGDLQMAGSGVVEKVAGDGRKEKSDRDINNSNIVSVMQSFTNGTCSEECLNGCFGDKDTQCVLCKHFKVVSDKTLKLGRFKCVRMCEGDYYPDLNAVCNKCDGSCASCHGSAAGDCTACREGLLLVEGEYRCVDKCPSGFSKSGDNTSCIPCDFSCSSCEDGDTQRCISCRGGLLRWQQTCLTNCPKSTYQSKNDVCLSCHNRCETCFGPNPNECFTCTADYLFHNRSCTSICPESHFGNASTKECQRCLQFCSQCSSPNDCSRCAADKQFLVDEKRCRYPEDGGCDLDNYYDFDDAKCRRCHVTCESCYGKAYDQCLDCKQGSYLFKGTCPPNCPDGFYKVEDSRTCEPCHSTCAKCTSGAPNACLSCREGLKLLNSTCVSNCLPGYHALNGVCLNCHVSCRTCTGSEEADCVDCYGGKYLVGGRCLEQCPRGSFVWERQCVKCHPNCLTCRGDGKRDCLSCPDYSIFEDGLCLDCGDGMYYDRLKQKCAQCDSTCATCNGPDRNSCLSCHKPLHYETNQRRCVPCCLPSLKNNCCHCDVHSGGCLRNPSTDKRRISDEFTSVESDGGALSGQKDELRPFSAGLSNTVLIILSTGVISCLVVVVFVGAINAVKRSNRNAPLFAILRPSRRKTSFSYERVPLRADFDSGLEAVLLTTEITTNEDQDEILFSRT